jgi:N-acetylmuramoyl-L-alanine amidase
MRGDDVGALQLALGRLGFDAGRVDGIYGPNTHGALLEFQRNSGLVTDGIVGPDTVAELTRLSGRAGGEPVVSVRERERLRLASGPLEGRRVVVADLGGATALVGEVARQLRERGARALTLEQQDPSAQARLANDTRAVAFLGVQVAPSPDLLVSHFATPGFESQGGRRLGREVATALTELGVGAPACAGLRLPVLRETRMPAVTLKVGPTVTVVRHGAPIAEALAGALETWLRAPVEDDSQVSPQPGDKPERSM